VILNIFSNIQNKRLYDIAGWHGLLITAWIGTPIHELSHVVAAKLSGHRIVDLKLFKPDIKTKSLGYVTHSYNPGNFYQAIIGNTIIAIAPFFGGALAIYLITCFLLPGFSLYSADVPPVYHITSERMLNWESYVLFGKTTIQFFKYLIFNIFESHRFSDWRFYVFIFVLFGIANHLSPSASDFKNFWQPLAIILLFMTLLNLIILPFFKSSMTIINQASQYVFLVMPILLLAILIAGVGLTLTYIIYLTVTIFRR